MSKASRQGILRTTGQWLTEAACAFILAVLMVINLAPGAQGQAVLPPPQPVVSTIPSNGDVNPYGVAIAPLHLAAGLVLQHDDVLVTNFNNAENLQGTGTTIVRVDRGGHSSLFFQGTQTSGLTAALGIVNRGYVFAGSLPTADGTSNTVQAGSLLILDGNGTLVGQYANSSYIDGPWGMAIADGGNVAHVFVSNVLNGTITRLDMAFPAGALPVIHKVTQIGAGFGHRTDPAALALGPSGLAFDAKNDVLYVASSTDDAVYALNGALTAKATLGSGELVYQDSIHLHGPTQMTFAPNGDLLVANSDGLNADPAQPSEIVEFTTAGQFVAQFSVDANNGGAFGIAAEKVGSRAVRIVTVDDNRNTVTSWTDVLP
jgi:hypothetical protein